MAHWPLLSGSEWLFMPETINVDGVKHQIKYPQHQDWRNQGIFILKLTLWGVNPISPGLYKNLFTPGGATWPPTLKPAEIM